MALRARNIKPDFFRNEELGALSMSTRLLFIGLWCAADREGRIQDRPKRIAAELFPYDHGESLDVHGELTVLERLGFVRRFSARGHRVIEVTNFKKHQSPHKTEKASVLPGWDERDKLETEENQQPAKGDESSPLTHRELTVGSPLTNGEYLPDSLIHRFSDSKTSSSKLKSSSDPVKVSQKETSQPPSKDACRLAALLKSEIQRNKADYRITPSQERKWAITADRMLRRDGRQYDQVAEVIRWAQHDEFWMANVLSMDTLREKFDQLGMKMGRSNGDRREPPESSKVQDFVPVTPMPKPNPAAVRLTTKPDHGAAS